MTQPLNLQTTTSISESRKLEIMKLWNNEYPAQLAYSSIGDFDKYLDILSSPLHMLLLDEHDSVKGWYFSFFRNKEKWFAMIIDSAYQRMGIGTQLINAAKKQEPELNGWVIDHSKDKKQNGQLYKSPIGFYLNNGFEILPNERLKLENISAAKIKWANSTLI